MTDPVKPVVSSIFDDLINKFDEKGVWFVSATTRNMLLETGPVELTLKFEVPRESADAIRAGLQRLDASHRPTTPK